MTQTGYQIDINVDGKIIVIWIIKKPNGRVRTGLIWLRMATSGAIL
jgi:hypothetical protein